MLQQIGRALPMLGSIHYAHRDSAMEDADQSPLRLRAHTRTVQASQPSICTRVQVGIHGGQGHRDIQKLAGWPVCGPYPEKSW